MRTLGDTAYDNASYTGETGDSVFSLDYYRNKIRDFQDTMNAADRTVQALADVRPYLTDADQISQWENLWQQLMDKRTEMQIGAKAINLAAALGLGTVPGLPIAVTAFNVIDKLWDAANDWQKGQLTAIQAAVRTADAQAEAVLDATFPPGEGT